MTRGCWLLLAALFALLAGVGACLVFSSFMVYDDEGYVLFSLKNFAEHGGLYDRVYSQYGPFFFAFHKLLHAVGLDFTNLTARLLALGWWLGSVALCATLVWRVTRSLAATVFTAGAVFLRLIQMVNEPSHPGGLITLAVSLVALAGIAWPERPRRTALVIGAMVAALVLTKINVGVFLLAGVAAWWVLHVEIPWIPRPTRTVIVAGGLALLPVLLMGAQLGVPWVKTFALIASCSAVAVVIAGSVGERPRLALADIGPGIIAAFGVAIVTIGFVLIDGTSWNGLIDGLVLGPLRHPLVYTAGVRWRPGAVTLALIALAITALATLRPSKVSSLVVAGARAAAIAGFLVGCIEVGSINLHAFAMSYGIASTVFFVLPLGGDHTTQPVRTWLALLLVTQSLHAYPIGGSQIGWGTFLWVPLAAVAAHDLARWWRGQPGALAWCRPQWVTLGAAVIACSLVIGRCGWHGWLGQHWIRHSDNLRLPGAGILRLPEQLTTALRAVAVNASAHADVLFSLPGLHSFHLWTGLPGPTAANATLWPTLLTAEQQGEIRRRLEASPRSCVIVQRTILDFLAEQRIATESPLKAWLFEHYESTFALDGYEFWVRKGRRIAMLNTATLLQSADPSQPRYELSLSLAAASLRQVAEIELALLDEDCSSTVTTWSGRNAQVLLTPINSAGASAATPRPVEFPCDMSGLVRLQVRTNWFPARFPLPRGVLYLRDANGRRLAEARFVP